MHDIFVVKSRNLNTQLFEQFPHARTVEHNSNRIELLKHVAQQSVTEHAWVVTGDCDYSNFDFEYRPPWHQNSQLHVWPTENQTLGGDTVLVNAREFLKQADQIDALQDYQDVCWKEQSVTQLTKPEIFVWSRGNTVDIPGVKTLRHVGNHLEMMRKTVQKASTPCIWVISDELDYNDFDFNWRPDWATDKYLHVWPTENQTLGGDTFYVNVSEFLEQQDIESLDHYDTIQWHSQQVKQKAQPEIFIWDKGNSKHIQELYPNATVLRYIGSKFDMLQKTVSKSSTRCVWVLSSNCDYSNFDTSWRPSWATEKHLHVWPTENQTHGGDTFYVDTAEFRKQCLEIQTLNDYNVINWHKESVDEAHSPQIVIWASGKDSDNLTKLKSQFPNAVVLRRVGSHLEMMQKTVHKTSSACFWVISDVLDYSNFDFTWRPDWATESHLHVWPTENQVKGGDTYYVNSAEFQKQSLELDALGSYNSITWHKDSIAQTQQPDVVIWDNGTNQENIDCLKQQFPNAVILRNIGSRADMMRRTMKHVETRHAWVISNRCRYDDFDFSWRPGWATEKHLHVWPTESQVKGGDTFYVDVAEFQSQSFELEKLEYYDAVTWHKDVVMESHTPDVVIWDQGNKQYLAALKQRHPDAVVLRYVGDHLGMMKKSVSKISTSSAWIISTNLDYSDFDFSWRPDWATESHLHVWPTANQVKGGDTFYINTAEFRKQSIDLERLDYYDAVTWHKDSITQLQTPDVVIWDNGKNQGNLEYIKSQHPGAIVLRNIGSRFDMMQRTMRHVSTGNMWIVNSKCSYTDFDFSWRPDWATEKHLHVWPTENQTKGGDTFYVDVAEFRKQCLEIEKLEQYNAVTWHTQNISLCAEVDVIVWTFGGNQDNLQRIKQDYPNAKSLRYIGTHLEMLKKSVKYTDSENFWILSDCCKYNNFSTAWKPDWETEKSIHCWASGSQEFGDTFYVPRAEFLNEADGLEKLEYYSSIIWHSNGYPRLDWPVNYIQAGDIYSAVKNHKFQSIYEYFVAPGSSLGSTVDPNLWEKRHLIAYNKNGHVSLLPRDVISNISGRLSSYPYIQYHSCENSTQKPQDIVFISYDEKDADLNYNLLLERFPDAKRVHGIKGNVRAYKEAAKISNTPWYYAVFPKTKIDSNFDFDHHPDYLETPGHYIFNAHNVITDYAYGHGGVKMYHVKTTIEIEKWGYDFTLSSPVTVIPVNSCYLVPASPYEAWRTSFREVLKLKHNTTIEGKYRLHRWLTSGNGDYGEYSKQGASAALDYNGDIEIANSWEWLREQFDSRYN